MMKHFKIALLLFVFWQSNHSFAKVPDGVEHIVFDTVGSFHGFGDVAGPFWLAVDTRLRHKFTGRITIIADTRSSDILEKLIGKKIRFGEELSTKYGKFFIEAPESLDNKKVPIADIYVDVFIRNSMIYEQVPVIGSKTIILTGNDLHTPVEGNDYPYGELTWGQENIQIFHTSAGLSAERIGILYDPISEK